jgi:tRNA pseudouridine55 synthase
VRDLGADLGCGAAVASLRRTAIGPIRVEDASGLPLEPGALREAARERLIPIDAMPLTLASIVLRSPADGVAFCSGRTVALAGEPATDTGMFAVRDESGRLLGVGSTGEGTLRPRVVLPQGR